MAVLFGTGSGMAADKLEGSIIADRFCQLTRDSRWRKVAEVKLEFRTYHPQGMVVVGERFFLSSVEVLDRNAGRGVGHLFEVDFQGNLLRQVRLGEGPVYHPGGIDFDGQRVWVPVAEYRPNSRTLVYAVNPESMEIQRVFEFKDHLGALVCDITRRGLVGASWGSRKFYRWNLQEAEPLPVRASTPVEWDNVSHYVDYQDGQILKGTPYAIFGGISRMETDVTETLVLGGIELVDVWEMRVAHQLPVMLRTARGESLLRNPFAVESRGKGLRFYFVPEDDTSMLHVYDVD